MIINTFKYFYNFAQPCDQIGKNSWKNLLWISWWSAWHSGFSGSIPLGSIKISLFIQIVFFLIIVGNNPNNINLQILFNLIYVVFNPNTKFYFLIHMFLFFLKLILNKSCEDNYFYTDFLSKIFSFKFLSIWSRD